MAYPRSEQETTLIYEAETGVWLAYSSYPPHIRKLQKLTNNTTFLDADDEGNVQGIKCTLSEKQVRMVAGTKREMTEDQKAAAAKRLKKARSQKIV